MNNLSFTYYPDEILRMKASPADFHREPPANLLNLLQKMEIACIDKEGAGLAAQQVGLVLPVIIIGIPKSGVKVVGQTTYDLLGVINPKIIEVSNDTVFREEGCLSFPGLYFPVERPRRIIAEGWFGDVRRKDRRELVGMAARIFCHESDHINGILFIDRADANTRMRIKPKLRKIAAETKRRKLSKKISEEI